MNAISIDPSVSGSDSAQARTVLDLGRRLCASLRKHSFRWIDGDDASTEVLRERLRTATGSATKVKYRGQ
jgi:hypothetical protein